MPQSTVPPRAPLWFARHNKQQLSPCRTFFMFFVYGTWVFFLGLAFLFPELQLTSARILVPRPTRSFQGQGINMQHLVQNLNVIGDSNSSDSTADRVDHFTLSSSDRPIFKRWGRVFGVRWEVYFNLRNILPKSGTFLPGHCIQYIQILTEKENWTSIRYWLQLCSIDIDSIKWLIAKGRIEPLYLNPQHLITHCAK